MSRGWAGGSTRQWRKIRAYVLARDGHVCRTHAEGHCAGAPPHTCLGVATQAHHLDGKQHGDDPARLRAACQPCNRAIGDPATRLLDPKPRPVTTW